MDTQVAHVTHYFAHISVAVLSLSDKLNVGDTIHVLGHSTDFTQKIESLEVEHKKVQSVGPGDEVALKVAEPVHEKDIVYKVVEEAA